jgi:hypothetical protein
VNSTSSISVAVWPTVAAVVSAPAVGGDLAGLRPRVVLAERVVLLECVDQLVAVGRLVDAVVVVATSRQCSAKVNSRRSWSNSRNATGAGWSIVARFSLGGGRLTEGTAHVDLLHDALDAVAGLGSPARRRLVLQQLVEVELLTGRDARM